MIGPARLFDPGFIFASQIRLVLPLSADPKYLG